MPPRASTRPSTAKGHARLLAVYYHASNAHEGTLDSCAFEFCILSRVMLADLS